MAKDELTAAEEQQAGFIKEILGASGMFRPFAVFDAPLDCVRVVLRDCSVTEIRINDILTLLEANYPLVEGQSELVGFTIKGIAHLCERSNISSSAPWKLADFLDAVLKASAPRERVIVKHIVKPMIGQTQMEIERIAA